MEALIVILAMIVVGLIAGFVSGLIWKDDRPYGVRGDYLIAIVSAVLVGMLDWYLIPMLGFSDTMKYIGIALEPFLSALIVLWVVRLAKR